MAARPKRALAAALIAVKGGVYIYNKNIYYIYYIHIYLVLKSSYYIYCVYIVYIYIIYYIIYVYIYARFKAVPVAGRDGLVQSCQVFVT